MSVEQAEAAPMVCHGWCVDEPTVAFTDLDAANAHVETTGHDVTMTCTHVWLLTKAEP
jgi:hypothetical protein